MSHSQFSLLKTKRFLPLFVTQFLGAFNDNVFKNALVILIIYHSHPEMGIDPRLLVTAAAGIFILPFFLFSATAGQLADTHDKTIMIRIIKAIEILLMLCAAGGFMMQAPQSFYFLLGILFLMGTQSAFFGPLKYSILPDHLAENELIGANALVEAGTFLAILLGTIFGGLVILRDGGSTIIGGTIILTAMAGWLSAWKMPLAPARATGARLSFNVIRTTWNLARHTAQNRDVFLSIIGISWFWLVGFTFLAQFPVYASDVIGGDEGVVTLFLTLFSIGIAIGSLICEKMLKGKVSGVYVPLGALGMTASIFAFWLSTPGMPAQSLIGFTDFIITPAYWPLMASLVAISIFGGIYIVPLYAIMQSRSDTTHRSRTIAVNNVLNALFMVAASILMMFLLKLNIGIPEIFLIIGVANIPVALMVRRIVHNRRSLPHA